MKVIVIQRIFSNYRKPIFDRLSKKYDFILLHGKNKNGINQIITGYSKPINQFRYFKKETTVYLHVFKWLFRIRPDMVVHEFNPSIISLYPLLFLRFFLGFKLILWGHGFNKNIKNRRTLSSKVRLILAKKADALLFYSENGRNNFIPFIKPVEKLFVANNTLDTDYLTNIRSTLDKQGRVSIKNDLYFKHKYNIVFIGRLLKEKILPDIFVSIVEKLANTRNDIGYHIIGDGEVKNYMQQKCEKLPDIKFYGAIHDEKKIAHLLYSCDLLLNPGYLGLSVNHALIFGLPVFTFKEGTDGPFHSPEIAYLKHNYNGYLAEPFNNDELANAIITYLDNEEMHPQFKANAIATMTTVGSIQNMEKGFINAINYARYSKEK